MKNFSKIKRSASFLRGSRTTARMAMVSPVLCAVLLALFSMNAVGQVSITTSALTYEQRFDAFQGTETSVTSDLPGWAVTVTANKFYGRACGASTTGGCYGFGSGADYSLGYLPSTSTASFVARVTFRNNTGATITGLDITYNFENWRREARTNGFLVTSDIAGANVSPLSHNAPTGGSGSCAVISTPKSVNLTGLNIVDGATFYIQWAGDRGGGSGSSQGVGIDDFSLIATLSGPPPCAVTAPGVISSTAGQVFCDTGNTVLSLMGTVPGTGVNYQWKHSPDGIANWTNMGTNVDTLVTGEFFATTFYKCIISCATGAGVDSTPIYEMTVNKSRATTEQRTICSTRPFVFNWNGNSVTTGGAGAATYQTQTAMGCDSIVTLNLTVNEPSAFTQELTICNNQLPFSWNGTIITTGGTGVAKDTFTNAAGCDSVVTLNLNVNGTSATVQELTICNNQLPFQWNGIVVTAGGVGVAKDTLTNRAGCDSIITLNLTVSPSVTSTEEVTICNNQLPYTWNGVQVTRGGAGVATYSTTGVNGCDSVVTLSLNVDQVVTPEVNVTATPDIHITSGSPVVFAAWVSNGGLSPVILWRKNGQQVGTNSISYTDHNLADGDIVTCTIHSAIPCADPDSVVSTPLVISVSPMDIHNLSEEVSGLRLYPNPHNGLFTIEGETGSGMVSVEVISQAGQVVYKTSVANQGGLLKQTVQLDQRLSRGTYFVKVTTSDRTETIRFLLVK